MQENSRYNPFASWQSKALLVLVILFAIFGIVYSFKMGVNEGKARKDGMKTGVPKSHTN